MNDSPYPRLISYDDRLQRVTDYIHEHLDQPLDLNRVAEVACLSPYHWHRLYHALTGETAAATVKRLRLHRAAGELAQSQRPVRDIAARSGYPSLSSFTRIFAATFGMPPAQYRREGSHTQYRVLQKAPGDPTMFDVTVTHFAPQRAVTLAHTGSYMAIGKAFEKLYGWFATRGLLTASTRSIGIYYDDPAAVPEAQLRSRAGILITESIPIESPLEETPVAGGDYAVLRHRGPYADLPAAYQWLYGTWLPQSGRELAETPSLEEYLNDPRQTPPAELLTSVCLPLRQL